MNYSLRIFLSVFFISLFIYSCKEDDKPTKSNTQIIDIQSIVVDSDNNPIIGAEVQVFENDDLLSTDTTIEDGTIIFNEIEANIENLRLLLSHPFYQNLSIKYTEFKDLESIVLELDEDCCVKAKLVIKDKNDEPLKGVTVQLRNDGMKTLKKGMSNEDGVVEFEGVCKGEFEFRISKDGYKVIEEMVEFTTCDETYEYSFELNSNEEEEDCCESVLIFKPKNEDGEILNGTKVYIYKNDKIIEDPVVKDGKAVVDGLCEGEYVIVYKNDKYETKEVVVELGCDEEKTVEHTLTKSDDDCCEAILKFLVKDAKSKEYLSGVSVTLKLGNDVIFEDRKTNNDGYVIEDGLCKGEYTVIIEMDGYKTIETTWNVEKCDDFQEHFWLEKEEEDCCESALIFKPKNEDGEILNGTKVYIYKNDKIIEDPVVKDGNVVVDGLCEGEYVIVYKNDKYETKEVVVELGCDEEKTVEHTLTKKDDDCCEAILKFLVKDAKSKEYISGASVTLKLGNDVIFENRKTNNDGYVIEDGLCKGEYTVIIEIDGYKTIETTWNVEKCDNFQEHFWLEKEEEDCCESALIFKPKNEDGEILNGTKVYIYKNDKIIEDPVVKDGKAVVDGLCEGEYVIVYKNDKYETKEVVVELGCDEEKTVEHTLTKKDEDCCEAILKFLVKDAKSKEYISGASVTLKLGNDVIFENRKTNNDGYVIEDGLCKGEYTVIIEMDGYKTIETTWNVEKCDDFQEHFWLEKE